DAIREGSPNCITTNPSDRYGILSGFDAGFGYDRATGLGSVDAFNLVTASGWGTSNVSIPAINADGVLNAASYALNAPVAAGSMAAVCGSFRRAASISSSGAPPPPMLAGLSFKFASAFPVPLVFVSAAQVNIQVPWELTGQTQALLTAEIGGLASAGQ